MAFQSPSSPLVGPWLKPARASFFLIIKYETYDTPCSMCFEPFAKGSKLKRVFSVSVFGVPWVFVHFL